MSDLTVHNKASYTKQRKYKSGALKLSKKDLLTVTEHAPDVICRFDKNCRLLYVNPAIEVATGIPVNSFINKTTRELGMPEEHSTNWEEKISFVVRTGEQTTLEFPFLTPNGLRFFHTVLVPEFTEEGGIESILTVSRDITEKKKRDKEKEETVGFVSHELRTPVTSLKLTTQMLQQKLAKVSDKRITEHLARMNQQLDKMTNIISDLLDTTRIEHGSMKLQKKRFNFNELVKETVEDIQKTAPSHNIVIKGEAKIPAYGDRNRVAQVLTNLICNAIRYSPINSEIIVAVSSDSKNIICRVRDFGIGIPDEQQKKIFERFYRVKDIKHDEHMGLGLGLFISNEIIKLHNGMIWVKSESTKGSTFSFTLPAL